MNIFKNCKLKKIGHIWRKFHDTTNIFHRSSICWYRKSINWNLILHDMCTCDELWCALERIPTICWIYKSLPEVHHFFRSYMVHWVQLCQPHRWYYEWNDLQQVFCEKNTPDPHNARSQSKEKKWKSTWILRYENINVSFNSMLPM